MDCKPTKECTPTKSPRERSGTESSLSAGDGASLTQIQYAKDKVLTFNVSGHELDSVAVNGVVKFRLRATWGVPGQNWDNFAEITNIKVTQLFEGVTVPLSMRVGDSYKYGFNGMERDDEVKGSGNSYDFGARMYDSRLGRWFATDPLEGKYPSHSPYNFVVNSPIKFIDFDGRDYGVVLNTKTGTVIITANFYTINEKTNKEALAGAKKWEGLNGQKVRVGDKNYTIQFEINVKMGAGETEGARIESAINLSKNDPNGNTYLGSRKTDGTIDSQASLDNSVPLEVGSSDGKNITMTRWNVNGSPVYRGSDANSVGHEMGHNMGLDDPGGDYYAPGGAMDYDGPYDPSVNDVGKMIQYSYKNNGTDPVGSNPKTSFEVETDEK